MKGYNRWNYHPYQPLDEPEALERPYICRLEPGERELLVEWFDPTGAGDVRLCYTLRDSGVWKSCPAEKRLCRLEGLEPGRDYELYLENGRGVRSNCRLARTGAVPGKVINYLHPEDHQYAFSGQYLCSPSIVKLPGWDADRLHGPTPGRPPAESHLPFPFQRQRRELAISYRSLPLLLGHAFLA